VDRDRDVVLEREPTVSGDVVGMGVRLQHADDADPVVGGGREVRLDRVGGIDHDGFARLLVADEVGGATQVLVYELAKQHRPADASSALRCLSESDLRVARMGRTAHAAASSTR
jgi:hypothetical protein